MDVIYAEFLLIISSLIIAFTLFVVRRFEGSNFTPMSAWLLSWLLLLLLSVVFGGEYRYSISGLALMVMLVVVFPLGGMFATDFRGLKKADYFPKTIKLKFPFFVEILGMGGGLIGVSQLRQGFSTAGYGADDLFSTAASNASALYSGDYALPATANLGYSLLLMAAFFAAVRVVFSRRKKLPLVVLVSVVLISLLWTFTTTTRIYFGMVLLWAFCGYLAARVLEQRPINLLKKAVISRSILVIMPFFGLILFVQSIRLNQGGVGDALEAFNHMRPWLGGTVSAFCVWLDGSWNEPYGFGSYMFRAVVKVFGFESQDTFEMLSIGDGEFSNATTMLRGTLQDFGVVGSLIFIFLLGFVSVKAYLRTKSGSLMACAWLALFYAVAFFAPNNWVLLYGSRIYAFAMTCAIIWAIYFFNGFRSSKKSSLLPN